MAGGDLPTKNRATALLRLNSIVACTGMAWFMSEYFCVVVGNILSVSVLNITFVCQTVCLIWQFETGNSLAAEQCSNKSRHTHKWLAFEYPI